MAVFLATGVAGAQPVGTTFTYQCQVMSGGSPASGTYDFQLKLFDAASGGNQVGSTNCYDSVAVTDGLVTLALNFGDAFSSGTERYLEVGVRADTTPGNCGSGVYTTLSPRQDVTGAPLAIGLRLPFSGSAASPSSLLSLSNAGSGGAIVGSSSAPQTIVGNATGTGNVGVYGQNATSGSYGGCGNGNYGVYGFSPVDSGVRGETTAQNSAAVTGANTASLGPAYGGTFTSSCTSAIALYAFASATSGNTTAIRAFNVSDSGTALFAWSAAQSGATRALVAESDSPSGYAGYFYGRGYFSGFLGLGTDTPAVPLHVVGGSDLNLSSGGYIIMGQVSSANIVMDNDEIQARNNGAAAALFINANGGNVGIGTGNAQGFQLAVNGTAAKPGGGSWSTLSDARLKKNIRPLTGALDALLKLRGVTFEYIDAKPINELPGTHTGMIAQDVEPLFPQWVTTGPTGFKSIAYSGFEALTVEALRELKTDSDSRLAAIEADNQQLRAQLVELQRTVAALTSARVPHD